MAVLSTDLKFFKTTNNLGGAITGTEATGGNVWDAFTGDETSAGGTFYACVYADNGAAETAYAAKVWISSETNHTGVNVSIGLGASPINGTESPISDENDEPSGVSFSEAANEGAALPIGDLPAGQHKAVWLRIVIDPATAAVNNYTVQLSFKADTGA